MNMLSLANCLFAERGLRSINYDTQLVCPLPTHPKGDEGVIEYGPNNTWKCSSSCCEDEFKSQVEFIQIGMGLDEEAAKELLAGLESREGSGGFSQTNYIRLKHPDWLPEWKPMSRPPQSRRKPRASKSTKSRRRCA